MTAPLDAIFSALADPTRRSILRRLAAGDAQVGEIAAPYRISAPAVSRHLRVLEDAGLIDRRIEAQRRIISLKPEALRTASGWVEDYRQFWEGALDRLESLLAEEPGPDRPTSKKDKSHEPSDNRSS